MGPTELVGRGGEAVKKIMIIVGGMAVLAAGYFGSCLLAQTGTPASQPPAQTRVAVVNIVTVFQNYRKAELYKAEMERLLDPIRTKGELLRKDAMQWQKDLEDPKFDPAKVEQWKRGIINNKRQLEDLQEQAKVLIGKKNEEQVVQLYKEVSDAVQRYAVANGFHMVLAYGENGKQQDPFSFANISRKVQGMEMGGGIVPMYFHQALDISVPVAHALNGQYSPSGNIQPTGGFNK